MDRVRDLPVAVRAALFGLVAVAVLGLWWMSSQSGPTSPDGSPDTSASTGSEPGAVVTPQGETDPTGTSTRSADPSETGQDTDTLQVDYPVTPTTLRTAAGQATDFAVGYAEFRYDEDPATREGRLADLLANENTVDLNVLTPDSQLRSGIRKHQTVITAQVTAVTSTLVSPDTLVFEVSLTLTTTWQGKNVDTSDETYRVLLSHDHGWGVASFDLSSATTLD